MENNLPPPNPPQDAAATATNVVQLASRKLTPLQESKAAEKAKKDAERKAFLEERNAERAAHQSSHVRLNADCECDLLRTHLIRILHLKQEKLIPLTHGMPILRRVITQIRPTQDDKPGANLLHEIEWPGAQKPINVLSAQEMELSHSWSCFGPVPVSGPRDAAFYANAVKGQWDRFKSEIEELERPYARGFFVNAAGAPSYFLRDTRELYLDAERNHCVREPWNAIKSSPIAKKNSIFDLVTSSKEAIENTFDALKIVDPLGRQWLLCGSSIRSLATSVAGPSCSAFAFGERRAGKSAAANFATGAICRTVFLETPDLTFDKSACGHEPIIEKLYDLPFVLDDALPITQKEKDDAIKTCQQVSTSAFAGTPLRQRPTSHMVEKPSVAVGGFPIITSEQSLGLRDSRMLRAMTMIYSNGENNNQMLGDHWEEIQSPYRNAGVAVVWKLLENYSSIGQRISEADEFFAAQIRARFPIKNGDVSSLAIVYGKAVAGAWLLKWATGADVIEQMTVFALAQIKLQLEAMGAGKFDDLGDDDWLRKTIRGLFLNGRAHVKNFAGYHFFGDAGSRVGTPTERRSADDADRLNTLGSKVENAEPNQPIQPSLNPILLERCGYQKTGNTWNAKGPGVGFFDYKNETYYLSPKELLSVLNIAAKHDKRAPITKNNLGPAMKANGLCEIYGDQKKIAGENFRPILVPLSFLWPLDAAEPDPDTPPPTGQSGNETELPAATEREPAALPDAQRDDDPDCDYLPDSAEPREPDRSHVVHVRAPSPKKSGAYSPKSSDAVLSAAGVLVDPLVTLSADDLRPNLGSLSTMMINHGLRRLWVMNDFLVKHGISLGPMKAGETVLSPIAGGEFMDGTTYRRDSLIGSRNAIRFNGDDLEIFLVPALAEGIIPDSTSAEAMLSFLSQFNDLIGAEFSGNPALNFHKLIRQTHVAHANKTAIKTAVAAKDMPDFVKTGAGLIWDYSPNSQDFRGQLLAGTYLCAADKNAQYLGSMGDGDLVLGDGMPVRNTDGRKPDFKKEAGYYYARVTRKAETTFSEKLPCPFGGGELSLFASPMLKCAYDLKYSVEIKESWVFPEVHHFLTPVYRRLNGAITKLRGDHSEAGKLCLSVCKGLYTVGIGSLAILSKQDSERPDDLYRPSWAHFVRSLATAKLLYNLVATRLEPVRAHRDEIWIVTDNPDARKAFAEAGLKIGQETAMWKITCPCAPVEQLPEVFKTGTPRSKDWVALRNAGNDKKA